MNQQTYLQRLVDNRATLPMEKLIEGILLANRLQEVAKAQLLSAERLKRVGQVLPPARSVFEFGTGGGTRVIRKGTEMS